ncbi:uncharacterized protein [Lolium perenne]|uniref:uncharacterized protein n=1 Tax=Lolium perenne TaxID=4522 RepID=UPI0021F5FAB0|nr:uncharacterized protein LOC127315184 [Lolium perenne]
MATPTQSPLRRWKPFFRAFDSIDADMEAFDPVEFSRREFRTARGDIVERLCDAADDDQAERLCLLLDDVMAESLETLRLLPLMPTVLAKTDLAKCVRALHKDHESERVRVLAGGIVAAWGASVQDDDAKVKVATHKMENLPQQLKTMDHPMQPAKTLETSAKKTVKITSRASDPVAPGLIFRGDRVGLIPEEKIQAAKRKFNQRYQEADDAKRRRLPIKVVAPEMIKQTLNKKKHPIMRERSQARCGSSMVKKTLIVTRLPSHHRV